MNYAQPIGKLLQCELALIGRVSNVMRTFVNYVRVPPSSARENSGTRMGSG